MKENSQYRQLNLFFEDISVMIASGQPMSSIISGLAEDADGEWKNALRAMVPMLIDGASLSEAMATQEIFPAYARNLVAAGEQSGHMEDVAGSLASFYESREQLRILADSALVQPLTLLSILAVVLACFMGLVLPIIGRVYRSLGGGANIYMIAGYAIGGIAFIAIAAALIVLASVKKNLKTKGMEEIWLFKSTKLSSLIKQTELAFFMSDFSTRVSGGILLDYAFTDAAKAVADEEIKNKLLNCSKKMAEGENFAASLLAEDVLPKTSMHIISAGIRNGRLENALEEVSKLLYRDAEVSIQTLVMKIEPILTGFFTIAIGLSLLSVMLPLIGVITSIG